MRTEDMLAEAAAALKGKTKAPRKKKEFVPPVLDDFAEGNVLAFDQTFSKTGFVHLVRDGSGLVVVRRGVILEPPIPDLSGQEDTLQRATWMVERIRYVLDEARADLWSPPPLKVIHERPATSGYRIESSLMGALGVWLALSPQRPEIVSSTHVRAVLTGQPHSRAKGLITQAVNRYLDTKGWNADQRDALALALTYLYDKKKAS